MWIFAKKLDARCPYCNAYGMIRQRRARTKCVICFQVWDTELGPRPLVTQESRPSHPRGYGV